MTRRPDNGNRQILQADGTERNPAGRGVFDDHGADFSHLLDDPGLGLAREEIETLFDLVDEEGREVAEGTLSRSVEDDDGGDGAVGTHHARPRVRRVDRGLLLFLQKRGLRRRECMDATIIWAGGFSPMAWVDFIALRQDGLLTSSCSLASKVMAEFALHNEKRLVTISSGASLNDTPLEYGRVGTQSTSRTFGHPPSNTK